MDGGRVGVPVSIPAASSGRVGVSVGAVGSPCRSSRGCCCCHGGGVGVAVGIMSRCA